MAINNLLERSLGEVKRRSKVIGRFPGETSCLTLVWAVLDLYIAHATNGIKFTQLERQQLTRIRYEGNDDTTPEEAAYEQGFGLPRDALAGLGATATQDAGPARGRHPVLLLSHGAGLSTAFHVAQATDLASHGFVVVGIDHPGDAELVDVGGGELIRSNPTGDGFRERSFRERVADERYVVDHLAAVRGAGVLDRGRIGTFGHSLGGATAAQVMAEDRRFAAGVNIDGAMLGSVIDSGLDRPFGVLLGTFPLEVYDGLEAFRAHMRAPLSLERQATTGHQGFTDIVWLLPQLGADPTMFDVGTVDPGEAVRLQRQFLRDFFARALATD